MKKVVIVDYSIGNILSVKRAFEHCDADVILTSDEKDILAADRLVVPGVGAFNNCVSALESSNLKNAVVEFTKTQRPYLGICVGMQMMLDESEEFGKHKGLGFIEGNVTKIGGDSQQANKLKVPFVGWKPLHIINDTPLLKGLNPEDCFYFVHSYQAHPSSQDNVLANYKYNELNITAAVGKGNMYGTQFHPEKSGDAGLQVIKNFLEL